MSFDCGALASGWSHRKRRRQARASAIPRAATGLALLGLLVFSAPGILARAAGAQEFSFTAVTFNVGTTQSLPHDLDPFDGYTSVEAEISDQYYGDGLAWVPAITAVTDYLALVQPEVVTFQEIFDPNDCSTIPASARTGFICETWLPGDPLVVEQVLGPDYQIACHLGKSDKCLGVRTDFGSLPGCSGSLCLDGLDGAGIPGCGSGSRVGRGRIQLAIGGELTVAHIHGTSGSSGDDQECREEQIEQLFQNLDGTPAADGLLNLILGDFNTDPVRLFLFDTSARMLADYVGLFRPFYYISDNDPASYLGILTLDHVISDSLEGSCDVPGLTPGVPAVFDTIYFDHKPVECTLVPEPGRAVLVSWGTATLLALRLRRKHARRSAGPLERSPMPPEPSRAQ